MENSALTLEPIRWQDDPCRIVIRGEDPFEVFLQVTRCREVEELCRQRPVEELPRITPLLGRSHYLAAAGAMESLRGTRPSASAGKVRGGLLQAQYIHSHLRRLFLLLTHWINPFVDYRTAAHGLGPAKKICAMSAEIMHHVALAQEAETILGGRVEYPLGAGSGFNGRLTEKMNVDRLAVIAGACLDFAPRLAAFMREWIFASIDGGHWMRAFEAPAMAGLSLGTSHGTFHVANGGGTPEERFPVAEAFHKIERHKEDWTRQPFYCLKVSEWTGIGQDLPQGLFFVGPLARLNSRQEEETGLAQQERLRLVQAIGPFPHFSVLAAFWALLIELIQASEKMHDLFHPDASGADACIPMPALSSSGCAAVEAPEGLIVHHYKVDAQDRVQETMIMDAAGANNGLKCWLAAGVVRAALSREEEPAAIREKTAMALLPF